MAAYDGHSGSVRSEDSAEGKTLSFLYKKDKISLIVMIYEKKYPSAASKVNRPRLCRQHKKSP